MSKGAPAAARSAAALAGFLVVAGLQLTVVLLILWTVLWVLPSGFALRAGVPLSIATVGALGYATWRALHTRHRIPAGVAIGRDQAPGLWELVDGASAAAGVPTPDGVTVVADATAAVGERTRLLGILGGRRDLYLGLPLLQALEPGRLTAIVTHELAHGSPALGRWAPLAYRGRVAVGRTIPRISPRNPAGLVLRLYAGFYRRADASFSREQELAADRIAAAHVGAPAVIGALRDLPALAGMQRLFHAEYVGPGWQAGYVPDDVFGGLLRVLAARTTEMTMLRAREPEPAGPWDTHPPASERIAALTGAASSTPQDPPAKTGHQGPASSASSTSTADEAAAPSGGPAREETAPATDAGGPGAGSPADASASGVLPSGNASAEGSSTEGASVGGVSAAGVPAVGDLVPDLPGLGRALQDVAFPPRGRTVVSWDECLSVARTNEMEREAEAALAAISRAVDAAVPDAAHLLTLAADGRLRAAAQAVFPEAPPEETTSRIVELLGLLLALAALRSGVARWRHSWTGAAEVVAVDGDYLNLAELAAAAADPETTEAVRAYLTRAGVDLAAPAAGPGSARAQVLGGLVNLSADGERTDVLITDLGLLLVPGLPRSRGHESKRRLTRIAADGVPAGAVIPTAQPTDGVPAGAPIPAEQRAGGAASRSTERRAGGVAAGSPALPDDGGAGSAAPRGDGVAGFMAQQRDGAARSTAQPGDGVPAGSSESDGSATSEGTGAGTPGARVDAALAALLPEGGRFVPFADVAGVTTLPGRRKGWVIGLRAGGDLTLRPALDADELPGGWAAWDDAVTFLAGTR